MSKSHKNLNDDENDVDVLSGENELTKDDGSHIFETGQIIFEEGGASDCAYLICEGDVALSKNLNNTHVPLTTLHEGEVFGEMGLLEGKPRSATAIAQSPLRLERIDREQLLDKFKAGDEFVMPVLNQLISELRSTSDKYVQERSQSIIAASKVKNSKGLITKAKQFFNPDHDLIEFQPDAIEIEKQPVPAVAKVMLYTILLLCISVLTWASFAEIDKSVVATGRITTKVPNITVQPSDTAVIKSIRAKEGQIVEKGDILATLDATFAVADANVSRASLISMQAQERRLSAELAAATPVDGFSDDPAAHVLQSEIFIRRQSAHQGQLKVFDERINDLKEQIQASKMDVKELEEQVRVIKELEGMRAALFKKGHGSRVNYLMAKNQRISVQREKGKLIRDRGQIETQLKIMKSERASYESQRETQIVEELVNTRRETGRLVEMAKKMERRESLVRITAPARGIILSVAPLSVGSVIQHAETMFVIVPTDVPIEMEVEVSPKDVGLIQTGDIARIKLDALPFQKHGTIEGAVRLISEDAEQSPDGLGSVKTIYRSRIEITHNNLRNIPKSFRFASGLTGTSEIMVGKSRVINYFIYPLVRALDTSFREP